MGVRLSIVCVTVNRTELPVHTGHLLGGREGGNGGYFCMRGGGGWRRDVFNVGLHYHPEQDEQCKQGGGLVLESNNGKNLGGQMSDMVVQILNS